MTTSSGKSFGFSFVVLVALLVAVHSLPFRPDKQHRHARNVRNVEDGRLARRVVPRHYNVELQPDIYTTSQPPFTFRGTVEVFITCLLTTDHVILNMKGLDITTTPQFVADPNSPVGTPSPILLAWSIDPTTEFLTLSVVNQLVPQAYYIIRVTFNGELRSDNNGLYWDSYIDSDGSTKYLVATQMESIEARSAFPCFDEPDMKATFNITVVSKPPHTTLSNMPVYATEDRSNGWVAYKFETSPVMSSYQVCVAVGDFVGVEAQWQNVTTYPVTIYVRPQMVGKTTFAARAAPLIQAWLERETGIPYSLPKMDHIALPSKSGAMENWGLITYGEYYLLVDQQTSQATGVFDVASVIAHELAHQWYGNLVTCKWWDDIWLNEGFATFYNFYPQEALGWHGSEMQQADKRRGTQQFLDVDQANTSDPIRKIVDNVWSADAAFSGSTYPKGGAVIRQLKSLLSYPTFKQGLTNYLTKYSYSSATTDDLWAELTAQALADGIKNPDGSDLDVKAWMDAWLNQMGYPVLAVTRNGDGTATVTSRRFLSPRGQFADTPSNYSYSWNIPISVATRNTEDWDLRPTFVLPYGQSTTTISGLPTAPGEWFLINAKQMSFYRVDYDSLLRDDITSQLDTDHTVIPLESRAQLIDDSFALSRTLNLPISYAMDTTWYLSKDFLYNSWSAALKHMLYIDKFMFDAIWHSLYRNYIVNQLQPIYDNLGWSYSNLESPMQQFLRRDAIINMCYYGDPACRSQARTLYANYIRNPDVNSVNANNLPTVLCVGVSEGTGSDWSLVFDQYLKRKLSPIREERYTYLFGMACSSDTAWLDRLLSYAVRGDLISKSDANTALTYMIQNRVGLPIVWYYFANSWRDVPLHINKRAILRGIMETFFDPSRSNEFNNFVGNYPPISQAELEAFRQMDLTIIQNMDFTDANAEILYNWLSDKAPLLTPGRRQATQKQLPLSPMVYWDSVTSEDLY